MRVTTKQLRNIADSIDKGSTVATVINLEVNSEGTAGSPRTDVLTYMHNGKVHRCDHRGRVTKQDWVVVNDGK